MKYEKVIRGKFIARPNRFIAQVEIEGRVETVHVKNTGRCKELLVPGATVYLSVASNPERKTKYDLIAVEKERETGKARLVNMDSQIVNDVAYEYLRSKMPNAYIKREATYKKSRFDFYFENEGTAGYCEAKGVTLENGGVVSFPDAPTERGIKHLGELVEAKREGYDAFVLFVIQMDDVMYFEPNDKTHKAFGDALRRASLAGVGVLAVDCLVSPDEITAKNIVEVRL